MITVLRRAHGTAATKQAVSGVTAHLGSTALLSCTINASGACAGQAAARNVCCRYSGILQLVYGRTVAECYADSLEKERCSCCTDSAETNMMH